MTPHKSSAKSFARAASVCRGDGVEAIHAAAIAVVDARSRLTHVLGEPAQAFMSRSSIKPLQALPLVQRGGLERFGFGSEELALCTASHNGSDRHRSVVAGMLSKLGLDATALSCGCGLPLELKLSGRPATQGEDRDPLRHNCSGKHAGFLALARLLGQPVETYLEPEGAAQRLVRQAVADACEVEAESLLMGVDGCSAPNFALPLRNLAVGIKNLVLASENSAEQRARGLVRDAMLQHPLLVSGHERLDYDLALAFPSRAVVKGGAEAVLLLGFRQPALGIAIKVLDGGARALGAIAVECLKQLGIVDDMARFPTLSRHEAPVLENARHLATGRIRAEFQLQRAEL